jgi:hypothetical protein
VVRQVLESPGAVTGNYRESRVASLRRAGEMNGSVLSLPLLCALALCPVLCLRNDRRDVVERGERQVLSIHPGLPGGPRRCVRTRSGADRVSRGDQPRRSNQEGRRRGCGLLRRDEPISIRCGAVRHSRARRRSHSPDVQFGCGYSVTAAGAAIARSQKHRRCGSRGAPFTAWIEWTDTHRERVTYVLVLTLELSECFVRQRDIGGYKGWLGAATR